MSIRLRKKIAAMGGLVLAGLGLLILTRRSEHWLPQSRPEIEGALAPRSSTAPTTPSAPVNRPPAVAPFIVTDTVTDSPGTNLETRVVTFTAEIGGTPPISLQWKVDKGGGFVVVSAGATNSLLRIANARVADTGLYALFATNGAGEIKTTPVRLVVVEGVD